MKDAFEVAALAALGKLNKQQMKQQQVCYSDYLQAFATFSDDFKASGTVTFINLVLLGYKLISAYIVFSI